MDNKITAQVQMLGDFCLSVGGGSITSKAQQAKKPWNILEYLAYHHDRNVPSEELVDIIWSDGKNVNSANALKTLIFRTRKLLESLDIPAQQVLLQSRGAYCWNPEVKLVVDAHEFENFISGASSPT